MFANARARSDFHRNSNVTTLSKAMAKLGIELPRDGVDGPEYARWSGISLQAFVGMVRGQTASDYRPNKNMVPEALNKLCKNYTHLEQLQKPREGVEVRLKEKLPQQQKRPSNHGSARH
ncbi:hypothetical protein PC129_g16455 [Phytophthora cactorum]|uniref:Uncharacterized protein n=1 Tax=Phytophthora cactorum TaxID=29920 RepID=A0A329SVA9_9STRA|nr:hypothetical protein Pcac1_g21597 [Phytophthora cactorum]KAG2808323.1 hypothetical protein PC111_g16542 [Phytophthora cactorum]KAG2811758.1 hypothetical protein PC112_g15469 [Phytophthora cactorum]KAG2857718.1 hypothetical protein PC113_g10437 [Phytophthora cactorum]KAG2897171.1 hypothetical protein PC115_g17293 [Phytophthora cactorum]